MGEVGIGFAPRSAALAVLRAIRSETPLDVALDEAIEPLAVQDARLAHELAAGTLRHRTTLDRALRPLVDSPWHKVEPDVRDVLRIGAHQLLHLDRIPPYAAVQATVETAKRECGRASGLVNAVLRRLADAPPPETTDNLAEEFSHPEWLVNRWVDRFGRERVTELLTRNNRRPDLTLRPARWSLERLRTALAAANLAVEPDGEHGWLCVREAGPVADLPGYGEGAFVVQDGGQARLIEFAGIEAGSTTWDACAAPGGKTIVLAEQCRVIASDRGRGRIGRLADNLDRVGRSADLFVGDARYPPVGPSSFDAVLVDAPCSGTGTFQRHPDARWRLTSKRLAQAVELQSKILDAVAPIVRPSGLLVYLTCSLESDENEDRIDAFLDAHHEYEREGDDLFIFPPDHDTDGGYGARLRRAA